MKKWFTICRTENGWLVVKHGYLGEKVSDAVAHGGVASFDSLKVALTYIKKEMLIMAQPPPLPAPAAPAPKPTTK